MYKKLISLFTAALMIMTVMAVTAFAEETALYDQDFTGVYSDGSGWPSLGKGDYLCTGISVSGIGGKATTDTSINLPNANYLRVDRALYGHSTVEYNLLETTAGSNFRWEKSGGTDLGFPTFRYDSTINWYGTPYVNCQLNKWYHIAIELNFDDATDTNLPAGTFNYYVNGTKVVTAAGIPGGLVSGTPYQFRFTQFSSPGGAYIDDVKMYSGTYDASKAVTELSSSTLGVVEATVPVADMTGNDYITNFTASNGGKVTGVYKSATLTPVTTEKVSVGDVLAVESQDKTYSYYTIVQGDSIISSGNYTLDDTANTISGIYRGTTVNEFKEAIVCLNNSTEKTVKNAGNTVTSGVITNGMTLTVGSKVYTLSLLEDILSEDFTGKAGVKLTDYANPSAQADAAGIKLNYTTFSDTENGPYAEVVNDASHGEVMKLYNKTTQQPFIGKNFAGLTEKNVLELSIKKGDINASSKIYFLGLNANTPEGVYDSLLGLFINFETNGNVYFMSSKVGTWNVDTWYRCVLVSDIPNNIYSLYINGVKLGDFSFEEAAPTKYYYFRVESGANDVNASNVFIDDVNVYYTAPNKALYDNDKLCSISSDSLDITTKYTGGSIRLPETAETVGELFDSISYVGAAPQAFYADGEEISDPDAAVAEGMYLVAASLDGFSKIKYTVIGESSISNITFEKDEAPVSTTENGTVSAKITVTNTDTENPITGYFIIALYDDTNKLISVKAENMSVAVPSGEVSITTDITRDITVTDCEHQYVKAFVWESATNITPVISAETLPLKSVF